jgi:hypothetical protein
MGNGGMKSRDFPEGEIGRKYMTETESLDDRILP